MMGPINIGAVRRKHARFVNSHKLMVDKALEGAGRAAETHVKTQAKFKRRSVDSLKDATRHRVIPLSSGRKLRVFTTKKHARYLEFGTKPHPIVARRRKALRFTVGGNLVFRRRVMHPGTSATRFLHNATKHAHFVAGLRLRVGMISVAKRF